MLPDELIRRKRLFVGSVFTESPRNATWYDLQRRYLHRTLADDFDHAVYLNRTGDSLFTKSRIVGIDHVGGPTGRAEHARGLDALLDYFRRHDAYEHCLLIDSDAFPFRDEWLDALLGWMDATKFYGPKMFAAAVRTENLDTFPHPCVFFVKGEYARGQGRTMSFDPAPVTNLVGHRVEDVGGAVSVWQGEAHVFLPLVRTNRWNPHPVLAGVYADAFYHHAAGSRMLPTGDDGQEPAIQFRSEMLAYLAAMTPKELAELDASLFDRLQTDADGLLAELRGT